MALLIWRTAAAMLELADTTPTAGAYCFRNPSLAPNMGRADIGESLLGTHPLTAQRRVSLENTTSGTHPLTVQGYTSFGDVAPGMIPSMALGRCTESDDTAQDRFWTRSRDVDSVSDFSMPEFDTRSEYDRYFAEIGARRDSAVASTGTRLDVAQGPWRLRVLPKVSHVLHLIQAWCHHSSRNLGLHHQGRW